VLSNVVRSALDFVFPIHCAGCGREGDVICAQCVDGLERLTAPYCRVCADPGVNGLCRWCGQSSPGFDSLRSPFSFEGPVRDAIHRLKYKGERASAGLLAGLMAECLGGNPVPADALVPIPLHPLRLRSRGYNQSALLAHEIGKLLHSSGPVYYLRHQPLRRARLCRAWDGVNIPPRLPRGNRRIMKPVALQAASGADAPAG